MEDRHADYARWPRFDSADDRVHRWRTDRLHLMVHRRLARAVFAAVLGDAGSDNRDAFFAIGYAVLHFLGIPFFNPPDQDDQEQESVAGDDNER